LRQRLVFYQASFLTELRSAISSGGDDDDLLYGQGGDDSLDGEAGNNTLDGGDGTDQCVNGPVFLNCP